MSTTTTKKRGGKTSKKEKPAAEPTSKRRKKVAEDEEEEAPSKEDEQTSEDREKIAKAFRVEDEGDEEESSSSSAAPSSSSDAQSSSSAAAEPATTTPEEKKSPMMTEEEKKKEIEAAMAAAATDVPQDDAPPAAPSREKMAPASGNEELRENCEDYIGNIRSDSIRTGRYVAKQGMHAGVPTLSIKRAGVSEFSLNAVAPFQTVTVAHMGPEGTMKQKQFVDMMEAKFKGVPFKYPRTMMTLYEPDDPEHVLFSQFLDYLGRCATDAVVAIPDIMMDKPNPWKKNVIAQYKKDVGKDPALKDMSQDDYIRKMFNSNGQYEGPLSQAGDSAPMFKYEMRTYEPRQKGKVYEEERMNIIMNDRFLKAAYDIGWVYVPVVIWDATTGQLLKEGAVTISQGDRVAPAFYVHFVLDAKGKNKIKLNLLYLYLLKRGQSTSAYDKVRKNGLVVNSVPRLQYEEEVPNFSRAFADVDMARLIQFAPGAASSNSGPLMLTE